MPLVKPNLVQKGAFVESSIEIEVKDGKKMKTRSVRGLCWPALTFSFTRENEGWKGTGCPEGYANLRSFGLCRCLSVQIIRSGI